MPDAARGWWNLPCWNALSEAQQQRLLTVGNLPIGWEPEGDGCRRGATLCIETQNDVAPGPRFYCRECAIDFLGGTPGRPLQGAR